MRQRESQPTVAVEAWERQAGMPSVDAVAKRVRMLRKEAQEQRKKIVFRKLIDQAMGELGVPKDERDDVRRLVGQKMGEKGRQVSAEHREALREINDELGTEREHADSRQLGEELERGGYEDVEEMHADINK